MRPNLRYLTFPSFPTPIEIREITETEFTGYKNDSEIVRSFEYYQQRLKEIELNKADFFEAKGSYTELFKRSKRETIDFDFKAEAHIDFNRIFINFITSFKSLIEHCENKVKEIFGEGSTEMTEFKTFLNDLHHENFSYKLADVMRNYAIHASYPIDNVNFDEITFDLAKTDCWFEIGVFISKNKIESSRTLRSKLRTHLGDLDELVDIPSIINKIMPLIERILKHFINVAKNSFLESAERLITLSNNEDKSSLGLTKVEAVYLRTDYKTIILPIDIAHSLLEFMKD